MPDMPDWTQVFLPFSPWIGRMWGPSLNHCYPRPMKTFPVITSIAVALAACALRGRAQEWPRFRGPNGTGLSHTKTIPTKISDADINWKVELPGTGHSSPVLWGERIFLTTTGDKSRGISVLCPDPQDGRGVWRRDFSLSPLPRH